MDAASNEKPTERCNLEPTTSGSKSVYTSREQGILPQSVTNRVTFHTHVRSKLRTNAGIT
jgi:hypothetical protein